MVETNEKIEDRKNKLIEFVKKNYILIGILLLALIIRIYYFWITKNQALWWDELSYGSLAKNLVTHQWDKVDIIIGETTIRPMLLPFLWSILIRMDFSEIMSKFVLEILPSFFAVILIYLVAAKIYNKRIALISSFILAVSWMTLFYSLRFMTHIPGLLLSLASIYFFFKATESDKITFKYFSLSIFLLFVSALFRWNYGLVGFAYFIVLLITQKFKFLKQKAFWLGGIIGSIPIIIFFVINLIKFGSLFPALSFVSSHAAESTKPFAFYTLSFLPHILQWPFLILFIIGLIILIAHLIIGFDSIFEIKKLKSHLFLFSLLIINFSFLIFYIKFAEDRYLFECVISIILIIAICIDSIYTFTKKYSKVLAIFAVIILLFLGGYSQYLYGNAIIMNKKDSYAQMKQSFLWLKENVPRNAVIIGSGIEPYSIYYSELTPIEFYSYMREPILNKSLRADYFVHHAFAPQDENYTVFLNSIQSNLTIVYVSYFDAEKKNPAVKIAKYNI